MSPAALVARNDADDEAYEGSRAWTIRTPFNVGQLDAEVTKAMNWRNNAGIIVEGDPPNASQDDPCRVWVVRGEVDEKVFEDTVRAHQPDPNWAPPVDIEALKERVRSGAVLAPHEQSALFAHLVS